MSSSEQVLAKKNSKIANDLWAKYETSTDQTTKTDKEEEKESPSIVSNEQCKLLTLKMNDGHNIPQIGLGTYLQARVKAYFDRDKSTKISADDLNGDKEAQRKVFESSVQSFIKDKEENEKQEKEFKHAVITAIKAGYRHIDTAQIYRTESVIGNALKELISDGLIDRSEVFITSKIAKDVRSPQDIRDSIDRSLAFLNVSYLDMMLIHSPHTLNEVGQRGQDVIEMYKILHEYKSKDLIKSIGVSNFGIEQLKILKKGCPNLPLPAVNQIECHPFCQEVELMQYCADNAILIESYCPLAQGKEFVTSNAVISEFCAKYKVTFAHILLRWQLQKGFVLLPKSVTPQRIIANADLFGFELTADEMAKLDLLGSAKQRLLWNPMKDVVWDNIYQVDAMESDKFDPEDPDVQSEGLNCINSLNEDDLNKVKVALKRDIARNDAGNVDKALLIFLNGIIGSNLSEQIEEAEDATKRVPESPNTRKVLEEMFEEKEQGIIGKDELAQTRNALQIKYKNRQSAQTLQAQNILVKEDTLSVGQKELSKNQRKDLLNKEMRKRKESDSSKKKDDDDKLSEVEQQKQTIYKLRDVILRKESQLQEFIDLSNEQRALLKDDDDKEEKEKESDVDIKRCLLILNKLNSEIVAFKVHFSELNVQQIGSSNVNEVVAAHSSFNAKLDKYEQVIDGIDACCRNFRECVLGIRAFVKDKFIPKREEYEVWNLEQMLLWIKCLESGRFEEYLKKLRFGFVESDILNGAELPDLSTADLSVTPFNIKVFRDKRDLIKHFKSLRNGLSVKQSETKRRNSEKMFHTNLIGTASKDTNDIAHEIFLENSQQYVD